MGVPSLCVVVCLLLAGSSLITGEQEFETVSPPKTSAGCGPCDESKCRPPNYDGQDQCLAGVVRDVCGCCYVCALREGQRCHPLPIGSGPSGCGESLECRLRTDLPFGDAPEALCACKRQEPLCGSDGKTYSNECQLTEARYNTRSDKVSGRQRRFVAHTPAKMMALEEDDKRSLKAVSRGPCKTAPKIVSPPEDVTNHTGHFVALSCEATGWPVPTIEWMIHRKHSEPIPLPSDDPHVAVQSRGGPSHYEVTSWLQLLKVVAEDEATYWCVAKNEVGEDSAAGKVTVLPAKDKHSRALHHLGLAPKRSG